MSGDQLREEPGFDGGLVTGALRMGRLVWVERSLAGVLGAALQRADDALVVQLAARIRGHIARAALVEARLPTLREFPLDTLIGGSGLDGWAAFLAAQSDADPADVLAARDAVALPLLADGYELVVATASLVGAPSVSRSLSPVARELRAELDRLEFDGPPVESPELGLEPLDH